jgi:hypothetical protein
VEKITSGARKHFRSTVVDINFSSWFIGGDDCQRQLYLTSVFEIFVEGFNPDERREWEDGVKMGMESGELERSDHTSYVCSYFARCVFFDQGHSETSARGNNSQQSSSLAPRQRPRAFLSVSAGGSIYLFSH